MNPSSPKKKSNTVSWFIVMVLVIILGISAFLVWKWQHDAANARLAQRLTEIQVSDAGKIRYEAGDEKIHVLTPYYSFDLPISWLGYCSLEYQRMDETYDWSDCYYVFSGAARSGHLPDHHKISVSA